MSSRGAKQHGSRQRSKQRKRPLKEETPEEAEARAWEEIKQEVRDVRQMLRTEKPGSEVSLIQRWGMNFVTKLDKNSYPTKPQRWQNSLASIGREASPRIAKSIGETASEVPQVGPWGHASRILDFPGRRSDLTAESWDSGSFEAALQMPGSDR
eukprot:Skav227831  [mRNA]  locus=scaffold948:384487:385109:+ [translate_table: standard]